MNNIKDDELGNVYNIGRATNTKSQSNTINDFGKVLANNATCQGTI